jgi:hypothetical protein
VRAIIFAVSVLTAIALASCGDRPAPAPQHDSGADAQYNESVRQLAEMTRDAEAAYKQGKPDDAAALIEKAEPVSSDVLGVPKPSLAAMQAASDLDDLYGRMLLANKHYEWALFLFQKCAARWKYWQPQTDDTARRQKLAESEIALCQRRMAGGR